MENGCRQVSHGGTGYLSLNRDPRLGVSGRFLRRLLSVFVTCLLMAWTGCAFFKGHKRDPVGKILVIPDRLFAKQGDPNALDEAIEGYLSLLVRAPEDQRVLGRLARAYTVRGSAHPQGGVGDLVVAREFGLRCLVLDPSFAGLVETAGGRITAESVSVLESDANTQFEACLVWTTIAWSRWIVSRGVWSAAADLDAVEALGRHAAKIAPDYGQGRAFQAQGLALALRPPLLDGQGNIEAARESFMEARQRSPDRLLIRVEQAELIEAREGNRSEWEALLREAASAIPSKSGEDRLENLHAKTRAKSALEEGFPGSGPWKKRKQIQ